MIARKYAVAAMALIVSAGVASAAEEMCAVSTGIGAESVGRNHWVAFYTEAESRLVPSEYLLKRKNISRRPEWRNKLIASAAPAGCESVFWTSITGGEKIGRGPGVFNVPAGKNTVSFMCRCK